MNKTVDAEVSVVLFLAVVAAVGVSIGTVGVIYRVIRPFPDAAAHEVVVFIEAVPIFLHRARAYAHRVNIFAEEIGLCLVPCALMRALADIFNLLVRRIHIGNHVVSLALCVYDSLVVGGYFGAHFMHIVIADVLAGVAARLVAQRPHGDARMTPVTHIHSLDPVKVARSPFEVVADFVHVVVRSEARAVSLDIRLVDYVETVYVGERY